MKTILIATDFSDNAKSAAQYAIDLLKFSNPRFILLNTYSKPRSGAGMLKSIIGLLRSESKRLLKKEKTALLDHFKEHKLNIDTRSFNAPLIMVINALIEKEKIDLLAIGAKGLSGLERVVAGSNSISIINKVRIPILIIPHNVRYKRPETIAFAMDNVKLERPGLLHVLASIAKNYDAQIKGISIHTDDSTEHNPSAEQTQLESAFVGIKHSFESKKYDNIVSGIDNYIHDQNTDLLVVVARKYNFFERLFHKSITKTLSILADIPMLILPDAK